MQNLVFSESKLANKSLTKNYDVISVSHYFYPRIGGLENMAYAVMTDFAEAGLKGLAVHGNGKQSFYHLNNFDCQSFHPANMFKGTYPVFGLGFTFYMLRLLKRNPQALVLIYDRHLTSSFITAMLCKLLGRKYVLISQTTTSSYFRNRIQNTIGKFLDAHFFKHVVRSANQIISVSEANKQYQIENYGVSADKFTTIYNCFNQELIAKFEIDQKQKIAAYVTKWIPVKDPDTTARAFLSAAKSNPDWRFIFAGDGECFISEMDNLPENLEVIPRLLTQVELFELLSKSAIYVNSSINEGLSLNVVEAAALGNIQVLSDAPSNVEVAEKLGCTNYNFRRADSEDLAAKLAVAITDFENKGTELTNSISEAAYMHFAQKRIMQKYTQFAQSYLQQTEAAPAIALQQAPKV